MVSPFRSMVPGRVRKSLVTPHTLVVIPIKRVSAVCPDLGRLPATALAFPPHPGGIAMAPRLHRPTRPVTMPTLHPNAAGIDIGATEIYACVSPLSTGR